jgi:hypothetical protein
MRETPKITVLRPDSRRSNQSFSFRVKNDIHNERSEFACPERLFVISDIEGKFRSLCNILIKARVIDKHFNWIFEDNHLVINGDCFDRGEEVTECLWLIYSLEEKAKKAGGYVHFILGNHEIMNMNGDWRYIHPKYAQRKNGSVTALYNGNNELWRWLCTKNIIERIGDNLFVHAGIAYEIIQAGLTINQINTLARPYYTRASEVSANPLSAMLYDNNTSPFWYRGYYLGAVSEEQIDTTLVHFNVKTIITGHTVTQKIDGFFSGKVINVNTDHAAGNTEGLLIKGAKFYRISLSGPKERIK